VQHALARIKAARLPCAKTPTSLPNESSLHGRIVRGDAGLKFAGLSCERHDFHEWTFEGGAGLAPAPQRTDGTRGWIGTKY
jgi:hypothetical protein